MKAEYLLEYLPAKMRANIENPHKALYNLLQNEKSALDSFRIVHHEIIRGPEYITNQDFWSAMLYDKNEQHRIYYQLFMPINSVVTPLSNFLNKKSRIRERLANHPFIMNLLVEDTTARLNVQFTKDRSFDPESRKDLKSMPAEQYQSIDFEEGILFDINSSTNGRGTFILLNDNRLLLTSMTYNYRLGSYSYEDLLTLHEKGLSGGIYSYKIFNEQGEMQN